MKNVKVRCDFRMLWMFKASDQSIIDRQGVLMQILLVAGLKIVFFTSSIQLQILWVFAPINKRYFYVIGYYGNSVCAY